MNQQEKEALKTVALILSRRSDEGSPARAAQGLGVDRPPVPLLDMGESTNRTVKIVEKWR